MPNRNEYSVEELARARASDLLVSHASKIHGDLHVLTARVPAGRPRRPGSSSPPGVDATSSLTLRNTSLHRLEPRRASGGGHDVVAAVRGAGRPEQEADVPSRGGR